MYCGAVDDDPHTFMFRCMIVYQTIHMGFVFSTYGSHPTAPLWQEGNQGKGGPNGGSV